MKEIGRLYKTTGAVLDVTSHNGKKFELAELQGFVGGYIELVPRTARRGRPMAFCNADGRLKGLEVNILATEKFSIELVGDVIQVVKVKS